MVRNLKLQRTDSWTILFNHSLTPGKVRVQGNPLQQIPIQYKLQDSF